MKATVAVTFKPGVLDPEASAIAQSLNAMGYSEVTAVKRIREIELELEDGTDEDRIREMCDRLLANPVIEDYQIIQGD